MGSVSVLPQVINVLTRLSYPKQPGDQPWSILDIDGAAMAAASPPVTVPPIVAGNPVRGGLLVLAQDFGLQELDFVWAMNSSDGFTANVYPIVIRKIPPTGEADLTLGGTFDAVRVEFLDPDGEPETPERTTLIRLMATGR